MLTVKFKKLSEDALLPEKMTEGAAGFDLYTLCNTSVLPQQLSSMAKVVKTGVAIELPQGYYAEIVLRSSIGRDTKLRLANQVGIIDADYRGEILLYLENIGSHMEVIKAHQRIAQLIVKRIEDVAIEEVTCLSNTERGNSAGGSTGTGKVKRVRKRLFTEE